MIGILNYGLGNIKAISNIFNRLGIENIFINEKNDLSKINKLILPGVGTFDEAINLLEEKNFTDSLNQYILNKAIPILGICVGMQIMSNYSEEGVEKGFGWIPGKIIKFKNNQSLKNHRMPHMGWNDVIFKDNKLFNGIINPEFYFLHSYYYEVENSNYIIGATKYFCEFASVINKDNIFATQFHPEKSHQSGIQLLKNFAELKLC